MNALSPTTLVHFYDTNQHRILCGLHGFEHRSTKHARSVTCQSCVGLLGTRARSTSHLVAAEEPSANVSA